MTKKKYKQFKRLKTVTPLNLDADGVPITVCIHSTITLNEAHINERSLFAHVNVRMINPKYTELIESQ